MGLRRRSVRMSADDDELDADLETAGMTTMDLNAELTKEKIKDAKEISENAKVAKELTGDLKADVLKAQVPLDHISKNVAQTEVNTNEATEDLSKSVEHQKSIRKKQCIVAILVLIILAVVALILYFLLKD